MKYICSIELCWNPRDTFLGAPQVHYALDSKKCSHCAFPPCTQQRQHPQTVKFHWERALSTPATRLLDFRQRIMESCWNAISASQTREGASTVAKHGEQKDQLRLDTCIPNTRGWCPIRKQMKPSRLVQEQRKGQRSQKLGPVDSLLANQELLDLWSTRLPAVGFQHYTVCWAPWAYIRDKYRLNLTAMITFTICSVLGCWQCCGGSQMPSCRGGTGLHAVVRRCRLAVCHGSCDTSKPNHTANQGVYSSIKKKTFHHTLTLKHACENGNLVHVEPSEDWLSVSFQACLVMPCQTSYSTRSLMSQNPPLIHMHTPRGMRANTYTYTCTSICTSTQRGCPVCAVLLSLR